MSDEQNFPTAIVPTRPEGQRARFTKLAEVHGDPMEKLFALQNTATRPVVVNGAIEYADDDALRAEASKALLPFGYRKLATPLVLSSEDGDAPGAFALHIHLPALPGSPAAAERPAIDVTPPRPALEPAARPERTIEDDLA